MRKRHIEPEPPPVADQATADANPAVYTITELAQRWRVNRHTITEAIKSGNLQAFKVGKRVYRVRESEAIRYERANAVGGAA